MGALHNNSHVLYTHEGCKDVIISAYFPKMCTISLRLKRPDYSVDVKLGFYHSSSRARHGAIDAVQVQAYLLVRVLTAQLPTERWPRAVWRALFEGTGVLIVFDRQF